MQTLIEKIDAILVSVNSGMIGQRMSHPNAYRAGQTFGTLKHVSRTSRQIGVLWDDTTTGHVSIHTWAPARGQYNGPDMQPIYSVKTGIADENPAPKAVKPVPTIIRNLPQCIFSRCDDAGYPNPTWADVLFQCESGLALIAEDEFYTRAEKARYKPVFERWLKTAQVCVRNIPGASQYEAPEVGSFAPAYCVKEYTGLRNGAAPFEVLEIVSRFVVWSGYSLADANAECARRNNPQGVKQQMRADQPQDFAPVHESPTASMPLPSDAPKPVGCVKSAADAPGACSCAACQAASLESMRESGPLSYLKNLHVRLDHYDARLDGGPNGEDSRAPTGDDYNNVVSMIKAGLTELEFQLNNPPHKAFVCSCGAVSSDKASKIKTDHPGHGAFFCEAKRQPLPFGRLDEEGRHVAPISSLTVFELAQLPEHCRQQCIEREIVLRLIRALLESPDLHLSVDGGDEELDIKDSRDEAAIFDACFAVDDATILVRRGPLVHAGRFGWVKIVNGNGPDCISDYTTNLESVLQPINEFCNSLNG